MIAFRPLHDPPEAPAPEYDTAELKRREKWLYRQRCKDYRTPLTIHDAPPRNRTHGAATEVDWLDPCDECGRYQWDIDEHSADRFCAFCAGVTLPAYERKLCYELRRRKRTA